MRKDRVLRGLSRDSSIRCSVVVLLSKDPDAAIAAGEIVTVETAGRAPSPLNGERAGVRGENTPRVPLPLLCPRRFNPFIIQPASFH